MAVVLVRFPRLAGCISHVDQWALLESNALRQPGLTNTLCVIGFHDGLAKRSSFSIAMVFGRTRKKQPG